MMRANLAVIRETLLDRRGQALVEFAASALLVLLLILGVVEFSRIMLVYTTVADAARVGARYAITHGTIPGNTASNADLTAMQSGVQTVVKQFLAPATVNVNAAGLSINTSCPNGTTQGNPVQVTVSYPYDLIVSYLPISVTLSSTSEGIITW